MSNYEEQIRKHRGTAPPMITENISVPASHEAIRLAATASVQAAIRSSQSQADQAFQTDARDVRTELAKQHSDSMLRLADELATVEQDKRRAIDAALTAAAAEYERNATAALSTPIAAPTAAAPISRQEVVAGIQPMELERRLEQIRSEFREREVTLRADLNGRIQSSRTLAASIRQAAATLRSKSMALEAAGGANLVGLPPRSNTPQMRHPSPQPAGPHNNGGSQHDAMMFLAEQQRGIAARQDLLTHSHRDWQNEQQHDEPPLQALEKYYRTQHVGISGPPRHVDPAPSGPDVNTQIVAALHKLNSKLEHLSARVAHISSTPPPADAGRSSKQRTSRPSQRDEGSPRGGAKPKRTSSRDHHHTTSPPEAAGGKRRDSSADLAAKWGGILQDVTKSKSHKTSQRVQGSGGGGVHYEEAIRHYLHDE
ncbi:Hypothetical protein, putative [Bodo saltans]|uniref:Uncharacterized protein n=1 Tax=Bodo saltans TaxID=75058 RepID=A0A0S4IQQ4_BODSA|nr:Hypothetical protein, putative [Bodo saltans]|eukprot:CUF97834.1 Hypothetical protein, putative [Bodo saltans]